MLEVLVLGLRRVGLRRGLAVELGPRVKNVELLDFDVGKIVDFDQLLALRKSRVGHQQAVRLAAGQVGLGGGLDALRELQALVGAEVTLEDGGFLLQLREGRRVLSGGLGRVLGQLQQERLEVLLEGVLQGERGNGLVVHGHHAPNLVHAGLGLRVPEAYSS